MHTIKVDLLSKKYREKQALKDVSFSIKSGEIVGIIGKNGAGKTTLFNAIAGNIIASSGNIFFDEVQMKSNDEVRKDFGILIKPNFYEYMKGYEFLSKVDTINKTRHSEKEIIEILDMVELLDAKDKLIKSYSFGMKQRLMFANALLSANKFMMLDEPFVGLDINARKIVKNHIRQLSKQKNIPIVFSDHNLDEVMDLCSRVILLKEGKKVYDGDLETFKENVTLTLNSTRELSLNLYNILDEHTVVVKKENLDIAIRDILKHTKIVDIKNVNVLNELLNSGGENV